MQAPRIPADTVWDIQALADSIYYTGPVNSPALVTFDGHSGYSIAGLHIVDKSIYGPCTSSDENKLASDFVNTTVSK